MERLVTFFVFDESMVFLYAISLFSLNFRKVVLLVSFSLEPFDFSVSLFFLLCVILGVPINSLLFLQSTKSVYKNARFVPEYSEFLFCLGNK